MGEDLADVVAAATEESEEGVAKGAFSGQHERRPSVFM